MDANSNPWAHHFVNTLLLIHFGTWDAYFGQVDVETGLQLLAVKLKVWALWQLVQLFNEEHGIVFWGGHEEVIISKPHQTVQIPIFINLFPFNFRLHLILPKELQCLLLQRRIVETTEYIRDAESLWDSFGLFELLLVKSDVVVLGYILEGLE